MWDWSMSVWDALRFLPHCVFNEIHTNLSLKIYVELLFQIVDCVTQNTLFNFYANRKKLILQDWRKKFGED